MSYKKCLNIRLDGKWDWTVVIWLGKSRIFSDCNIKSPVGKTFNTEAEANKDMKKVMKSLGII